MNQEKIGKYILKCRKEKKLTQEELAEKLGVTSKSISRWENGKTMPDISLFPLLCEVLDITANDLMSGEKVDDTEYVKTLEENVIKLVSNIEVNQKRKKLLLVLGFVFILLILVTGRIIYIYYKIDIKFDNRVMKCEIKKDELTYEVLGNSVFDTDYTTRKLNGKTIYFFHNTINLYNKRRSNWEYAHSMTRLLEGKDVTFKSFYNLDISSDTIEVYYTDYPIKKINKLSENDLKEVIASSYLICKS